MKRSPSLGSPEREGKARGREVSEGAYFYMARNKSGFPNRVSVCPIRLPISMLSAPFIEVSLFVSAEGLTEAAKAGGKVG